MIEPKHTPGPWAVEMGHPQECPWIEVSSGEQLICDAYCVADARLIAAAPRFLAASPRAAEMLRIAAKVLRTSTDGGLIHFYDEAECDGWCIADDCEAAADDIDAAIAKARDQS